MKRKILLFAIAILVMVGCNPATDLPATSTPTLNGIPNVTATVAPNLAPPLEIPTSSPNTPNFGTVDSCLAVVDEEIPLESIASGTVLIGKGYNYGQSLLDLSTGIKYEVATQSQCAFCVRWAVSPDKNLLAGTEEIQNNSGQFEKTILWILNAHAEVLQKITFNLPGLYNLRWLDNQRMILYTDQTPKDGTVIFFNPFTREQHFISNNFPDFYYENYYLLPGLSWMIEYSPDLEWGVYFGRVHEHDFGSIVYDFVDMRTLWKPPYPRTDYEEPMWSPKGNEVAVVANGHPYLVNRSGEAKSILDESQQSQVAGLSWSPNGRYLAFWNFDTLMIYDSHVEKVSDTCFKSNDQFPLIWSPDSQQVGIPKYVGDSSILIDIQENKIYNLTAMPEIIYPQDWMNSIP